MARLATVAFVAPPAEITIRIRKIGPRARLAPWRRRLCDAVFSSGSDLTCAGLPQQQPAIHERAVTCWDSVRSPDVHDSKRDQPLLTLIDTAPSYSPDGTRITFESDRGGQQQIYAPEKVAGSEAHRVAKMCSTLWSRYVVRPTIRQSKGRASRCILRRRVASTDKPLSLLRLAMRYATVLRYGRAPKSWMQSGPVLLRR
jgi:hypothetical protein